MKVYCLTETLERDGIRDFSILLVTENLENAKRELLRNVELDFFGDSTNNGFEVMAETEYRSKYNDGFTAYEITEHGLIQNKIR